MDIVIKTMSIRISERGRPTRVTGRLFEKSEHVAHANTYPAEYWTEVGEAMAHAGFSVAGAMLQSTMRSKAKL